MVYKWHNINYIIYINSLFAFEDEKSHQRRTKKDFWYWRKCIKYFSIINFYFHNSEFKTVTILTRYGIFTGWQKLTSSGRNSIWSCPWKCFSFSREHTFISKVVNYYIMVSLLMKINLVYSLYSSSWVSDEPDGVFRIRFEWSTSESWNMFMFSSVAAKLTDFRITLSSSKLISLNLRYISSIRFRKSHRLSNWWQKAQ